MLLPRRFATCRTKAIDVWSAGCIFAELMLRRPFFPGENYLDQLTIICKKLGKPNIDDLEFVTTDKVSLGGVAHGSGVRGHACVVQRE